MFQFALAVALCSGMPLFLHAWYSDEKRTLMLLIAAISFTPFFCWVCHNIVAPSYYYITESEDLIISCIREMGHWLIVLVILVLLLLWLWKKTGYHAVIPRCIRTPSPPVGHVGTENDCNPTPDSAPTTHGSPDTTSLPQSVCPTWTSGDAHGTGSLPPSGIQSATRPYTSPNAAAGSADNISPPSVGALPPIDSTANKQPRQAGSFTQALSTTNEFDNVKKHRSATHEQPASSSATSTLGMLSASMPQPAWVPHPVQPAKVTKNTLLPQKSILAPMFAASIPNGTEDTRSVGPVDEAVALRNSTAAIRKEYQERRDARIGRRWYAPLSDEDKSARCTSRKPTGFLSKIKENKKAPRITHKDAGILLEKLMKEYPELQVSPVHRSNFGKLNDFEWKIQALVKKQDNDAVSTDSDSVSIVTGAEEKTDVPQTVEIGEPSAVPAEDKPQATDRTDNVAEDASLLLVESCTKDQELGKDDTDGATQQSQPTSPTEIAASDAGALSDGDGINVQIRENHNTEEPKQRSASPFPKMWLPMTPGQYCLALLRASETDGADDLTRLMETELDPAKIEEQDGTTESSEASSSIGDDETTVSGPEHPDVADSINPQDIGGHEPRLESAVPSVRAQGQGEEVRSTTEPSGLGDKMEGVEQTKISNLNQAEADGTRLRAAVASAPGLRPRDVFPFTSHTYSLPGITFGQDWSVSQHLPKIFNGDATAFGTDEQSYISTSGSYDAGEAMNVDPRPDEKPEPADPTDTVMNEPTTVDGAAPETDSNGGDGVTTDSKGASQMSSNNLAQDTQSHPPALEVTGRQTATDSSTKRERTLKADEYSHTNTMVSQEYAPSIAAKRNRRETARTPEARAAFVSEMDPTESYRPLQGISPVRASIIISGWFKRNKTLFDHLAKQKEEMLNWHFEKYISRSDVSQRLDHALQRWQQLIAYGRVGNLWDTQKVSKNLLASIKRTCDDLSWQLDDLENLLDDRNALIRDIGRAYEVFLSSTEDFNLDEHLKSMEDWQQRHDHGSEEETELDSSDQSTNQSVQDRMHPNESFEPLLLLELKAAGELILEWAQCSAKNVQTMVEQEEDCDVDDFDDFLKQEDVQQEIQSIYWRMVQLCYYGTSYGTNWDLAKVPIDVVLAIEKTYQKTISGLEHLEATCGNEYKEFELARGQYEAFARYTACYW